MAENIDQQQLYEEYMNAGHSFAWEQQWEKAIGAYMKAVELRRDDPAAHNSLGLALLQAKRLPDALKVYRRAHHLAPDDPLPLEKSADILERQGRLRDAAEEYLAVADIYLAQHDLEKAIGNWERATRITPGLVKVHQRLALAYERIGNRRQAVREYLTIAGNYQRVGKSDIAVQAIERALRLEPRNPQALNALQALRAGAELITELVDERLKAQDKGPQAVRELESFVEEAGREASDANPKGPVGELVDIALEQLAEFVFSGNNMMEMSGMSAIQAIEYHRQGAFDQAITAYRQAEMAGLSHQAIFACLGSLMLEKNEWETAITYLDRLTDTPKLNSGANHGLAIAFLELGKNREATTYLIRTMELVDVGLAVNSDEAGQLSMVYNRLMQSIQRADEKTLEMLNRRLFELLTGTDWKRRVELTRHQLEDMIGRDESDESLIDVASVSPEIIQSMRTIDQYYAARRYILAMEEAYHIVQREPDYLPVHLRMAEILVMMNRISAAIAKYNQVAETYLSRGNRSRAFEILNQIVKTAPQDIRLRQNLIEMLEEDGRLDEVLNQYVSMGDAYMDLADVNNARTTLNQAIQLAQRIGANKQVTIDILLRLANIDMDRLEFRGAMRSYENIRKLDPENEAARKMLVDLNFRLNDSGRAIREMDGLLQYYAQHRNGAAILSLLEEWTGRRPNDEGLRTRLAAVYQQIKRVDKALEQYDVIIEMQLNAGRHADACNTIKRVLGMKPSNAKHYMDLFQQLGCG